MEVIFKLDGVLTGSNYTWQFNFMAAASNLLIGLVLFFGADSVVKLAYRGPDKEDEIGRF
ncbi:MAG TPA: hypothetical protein VGM59_15980 [Dongiaceae bacterium]